MSTTLARDRFELSAGGVGQVLLSGVFCRLDVEKANVGNPSAPTGAVQASVPSRCCCHALTVLPG